MPIPPAEQPNDARVVPPVAPNSPPTLTDVYNAAKFKLDVIHSADSNQADRCTSDDVGRAAIYEHTVIQRATVAAVGPAALAPPWLAVQQQFLAIQQQLNAIQDSHRLLETSLAKLANSANHDGSINSFVVVRFNDGEDPTAAPHNLPLLSSCAVIDNLPGHKLIEYLVGYGVHPVPNLLAERRRLLRLMIGCRSR